MGHTFAILGLAAALAQAPPAADDLRGILKCGDLVSVTASTGHTLSGRLLRIASDDLVIRAAGTNETVRIDTIQTLVRRGDSTRNGAILGAIIGAAAAGALFAYALAIDRNEVDEWGPLYAGYGAVFTGVGAFIGWTVDAGSSRPSLTWKRRQANPTSARRGGRPTS